MSTPRELLSRVATHPEEDEPRLAYARALPPEAAARAELIQAQVRLARRGLDPFERRTLTHRVGELLGQHDETWADRLRSLGAKDFRFVRGFVEELTLAEEDFAAHGERLLSLEPIHRLHLRLRDGRGLARAAARPWFAQLRCLWLSGSEVTPAAQALAAAPHAGRLEALVLSEVELEGVAALVKSEALPGLRALGLTGNGHLGDEAVGLLARTRLTLARLYLTATDVSDEGTAVLARAKALQSLEVLALNRNFVSDAGAGALAASKALVHLRWLELAGTEVSEEGALTFARPKALPALRRLDLRGLGLSAESVAPLARRLGTGLRL